MNVKWRHRECGGVAFETKRRVLVGMVFPSVGDVVYPSGRQVAEGDLVTCDACQSPIDPNELDQEREFTDAELAR